MATSFEGLLQRHILAYLAATCLLNLMTGQSEEKPGPAAPKSLQPTAQKKLNF